MEQTIQSITAMPTNQLFNFLTKFLKRYYPRQNIYIKPYQYIYACGDAEYPVALVAHLDTVFQDDRDTLILHDQEYDVMFATNGAGFDDRRGVYAICELVKKGYRPSIIFTTGEEAGGIGAQVFIKDFPKAKTKNLKYIIELDRQGYNDCVFYSCDNPEFVEYVEAFGFKFDLGSFTDISFICPEWGIAGVNLSVGYYREHSLAEILFVQDLYDTIEKVEIMLLNRQETSDFKYIPMTTKRMEELYLDAERRYS